MSQVPRNDIPVLNIPNVLTGLRLAVVPVFAWLLLTGEQTDVRQWITLLVFLAASLTDLVDGMWARRYNLITNFGKIADPIADKALTGTALVGLSIIGDVPWWATFVIIVREVAVTVLRFRVIDRVVIPASQGGKWKTGAQITAIALYLAPLGGVVTKLGEVMMIVAVALTITTGMDYAGKARGLPPTS